MKLKSLESLLKHAESLVKADLKHISKVVRKGKLDFNHSRDLISYTKLLKDAVEEQKKNEKNQLDELSKLSNEELEARAKAILSIKAPIIVKQEKQKPIFDIEAYKKIMQDDK